MLNFRDTISIPHKYDKSMDKSKNNLSFSLYDKKVFFTSLILQRMEKISEKSVDGKGIL